MSISPDSLASMTTLGSSTTLRSSQSNNDIRSPSNSSSPSAPAKLSVVEPFSFIWQNFHVSTLSWSHDFFSFSLMSIPKKSEAKMRLNLNIPYYLYNYILLMVLVTFPFLLYYNIPFLVVLVANILCFYFILYDYFVTSGTKRTHVRVIKWDFSFTYFGHLFLLAWLIILFFFKGARTGFYVFLLNFLVVIPHALVRNPTFFDDEELEKLRPKLFTFILMLFFVLLSYLEGDVSGPEDENARRAEQERKQIKALIEKENDISF